MSTTLEVDELLYKARLNITGMTEFGLSFAELSAGTIAPPEEGGRFDAAFRGEAIGPRISGTIAGIDYLRVRADGRFDLHIHETITTSDGVNIDVQGGGIAVLRPEGGMADIRVHLTLFTSAEAYKWVNPLEVWAIGSFDLLGQTVDFAAYSV